MNLHWQTSKPTGIKHSNRWGHSSATLPNNLLVLYGGYADAKFLKDVWLFNPTKNAWTEVKFNQAALKPVQRSNCSFIYSHSYNGIIMFGGGSHQNTKLNDLWCLEIVQNKENHCFEGNWKELFPSNGKVPWGRTYHVSQIFDNFLLIHGGQSYAGEIDDFWALNLQNLCWVELKSELKQQPRKFHSSAIVKQKFYIIGGIHGSYQTINKIQFVDLAVLKSQNLEVIEDSKFNWKEVDLSGPLSNIIGRWGHVSKVFQNNVYIFGGRTSVQQNDLLIFNPKSNSLQKVPTQKTPQGRRKPCIWLIGSVFIINSGYNGTYLSDQHWIDLRFTREDDLTQKLPLTQPVCRKQLCDIHINTSDNKYIDMYSKFIRNSFQSEEDMIGMIEELAEMKYDMASKYVEILSNGVYLSKNQNEQNYEQFIFSNKKIPDGEKFECIDQRKLKKYKITFSTNQLLANKKKILFNVVKENTLMNLNPFKLIRVADQEFTRIFNDIENDCCCDMKIIISPINNVETSRQIDKTIKCCKYPLILRSQYFKNAIKGIERRTNAKRGQQIQMEMKQKDVGYHLMKIVILYCYYGHVIIPKEFTLMECIELFKLVKRFSQEIMMTIIFGEIKEMIFSKDFDEWINFRLNKNLDSAMEKKSIPEKKLQTTQTSYQNLKNTSVNFITEKQFEELLIFCANQSKIEERRVKKSSASNKWEEILLYLTSRFAQLIFKKHVREVSKNRREQSRLLKKDGNVKNSLKNSISIYKENINSGDRMNLNLASNVVIKKSATPHKKIFEQKQQRSGYFEMIRGLVKQTFIDNVQNPLKNNNNRSQIKSQLTESKQNIEDRNKKSLQQNSLKTFLKQAILNQKNQSEFKFKILQSELYRA